MTSRVSGSCSLRMRAPPRPRHWCGAECGRHWYSGVPQIDSARRVGAQAPGVVERDAEVVAERRLAQRAELAGIFVVLERHSPEMSGGVWGRAGCVRVSTAFSTVASATSDISNLIRIGVCIRLAGDYASNPTAIGSGKPFAFAGSSRVGHLRGFADYGGKPEGLRHTRSGTVSAPVTPPFWPLLALAVAIAVVVVRVVLAGRAMAVARLRSEWGQPRAREHRMDAIARGASLTCGRRGRCGARRPDLERPESR